MTKYSNTPGKTGLCIRSRNITQTSTAPLANAYKEKCKASPLSLIQHSREPFASNKSRRTEHRANQKFHRRLEPIQLVQIRHLCMCAQSSNVTHLQWSREVLFLFEILIITSSFLWWLSGAEFHPVGLFQIMCNWSGEWILIFFLLTTSKSVTIKSLKVIQNKNQCVQGAHIGPTMRFYDRLRLIVEMKEDEEEERGAMFSRFSNSTELPNNRSHYWQSLVDSKSFWLQITRTYCSALTMRGKTWWWVEAYNYVVSAFTLFVNFQVAYTIRA